MTDAERSPKPATDHTRRLNEASGAVLSLDDPGDFERANRGLLAQHPTGVIDGGGHRAWDIGAHDFIRESEEAPPSVNPSLWRQGRLNAVHGLFEVADGVWQARGYDISNITFIDGRDGWVIIDPLTTSATARACLDLANSVLGERRVSSVIYTHSHADHFGGILGVTTNEEVDAGNVRIIAPEGFLREAVSENVIAGPAMLRRAGYMFGPLLEPGPFGHVDSGLGKGVPKANSALIAPTEEVAVTGTELDVDGVRIVFQNTPGGEAPAEMNFLFPEKRLLCMAENCTHTMHNLYTPRGAQVRDALGWSKYINEAIELFISQTDVLFASHHWPRFGHEDSREFLVRQRDLYRWLHDQTMRLANHGFTSLEIAEQLELPDCFAVNGHTRQYYGTVSHNSKAVYQRYLGWFDANPANLQPHPPVEAGRRYVEFMGGADEVVRKARVAFDEGDYRWVAQVVNHVVFAHPDHHEARMLQADALEQLGYQAESGPWRNFYLTGAMELRHGVKVPGRATSRGMTSALTIEQIFDAIAVRLDATKVVGLKATVNWRFTDVDENHLMGLDHCALHHTAGRLADDADVTLTLTKVVLGDLLTGQTNFAEASESGDLVVDGDLGALLAIFGNLDTFDGSFAIVEP